MAGHSKFKNIMYRKSAQDKKRASLFAKLSREITVATKMGGADLSANARLRAAVNAARAGRMPKDNVDRAIAKGTGGATGEEYESVRYEGYGPAGGAIIIEALTENRNRTASHIRTTLSKAGGNMSEAGSVAFMFDHLGQIVFPAMVDGDKLFEAALEAGANDFESDGDTHAVYTASEDLHAVSGELQKVFGPADSENLVYIPQSYVGVPEENLDQVMNLLDRLDDDEDTQHIFSNYDLPEEED